MVSGIRKDTAVVIRDDLLCPSLFDVVLEDIMSLS